MYACTTLTCEAGTPRLAATWPLMWNGDWQEAYTVIRPSLSGTVQAASGSRYQCSWCEVVNVASRTTSDSENPFSTSPFTSFLSQVMLPDSWIFRAPFSKASSTVRIGANGSRSMRAASAPFWAASALSATTRAKDSPT